MSLPFHSRAVQMPCPDSLEYPDSASLVRTHSRHETFKKQMESPFPLPTPMKKPLKHIYLKYEDTCEQWEPWPRNCTRVQSTADLPSESCTVSWCLRESNACDNNSIYLSLYPWLPSCLCCNTKHEKNKRIISSTLQAQSTLPSKVKISCSGFILISKVSVRKPASHAIHMTNLWNAICNTTQMGKAA